MTLPSYYSDDSDISTWLGDIFNSPYGLPCICSDQTEGNSIYAVRPYITRICQRSDNPCIIEVSFHLGTAHGIYEFDGDLSGFSFDTTNGLDGVWHKLIPDIGDSGHNPSLNNLLLAGTNQVDASWNYSFFNPSNPNHLTNDPCIPNYNNLSIPIHTFVFDMCEHVSSWLSQGSCSFRMTFNKKVASSIQPSICRS